MAAYVKLPALTDRTADSFNFSQLTTKPTASEDGTTKVYSKTLTFTATVTVPVADGTDDNV